MAKSSERFSEKCRRIYEEFFSKAALFIFGSVVSSSMAEYLVVKTLFTYLVENWENHHLPTTATIINLQVGLKTVSAVILTHISDSYYRGLFNTIVSSNVAYIMGLTLYWISAWFLSPNTDFRLFYVAALAIAIGRSGQNPVLKSFLRAQFRIKNPSINDKRLNCCVNAWWLTACALGIIIASGLSNVLTWKKKFLVSTLAMGANLLLFMSGFTFYDHEKPTKSPFIDIFEVLRAAISKTKRHINYPNEPTQYHWENHTPISKLHHMNDSGQVLLLPKYQLLRWLDKAAIIEGTPSIFNQEDQKNRRRLCTVEQVTDVKRLLTLIPLWTTFIAYSVVKATGNTFFIKQSSNMDVHIGKVKVPLMSFSVVTSCISSIIQCLLKWMFRVARRQNVELVGIGVGMVCTILCCITAWQVEVHRLNLIEKEGIDPRDPNQIISMSVLWLLPQFALLGLMEGFANTGLEKFMCNHVSKSMKSYGKLLKDCVIGFGNFFSIPCVLLFKSWFKDTINTSHLDRYFLALAILGFMFLCLYVCVLSTYARMEALLEDEESDEGFEDDFYS